MLNPSLSFQICDLLYNSSITHWRFLVLRVSIKHGGSQPTTASCIFNLNERWAIPTNWGGRLCSRPEGRPVIWPSMNRDPTKWPSYDGYSLETSLHPSSPSFPLSLAFHITFSFLSWIFVNESERVLHCPTSYMIMVQFSFIKDVPERLRWC